MEVLDDDNRKDDNTVVNTDIISFRLSPQHPNPPHTHTIKPSSTAIHGRREVPQQDPEDDFILDLLNGLKPLALKVQESILAKSFALPLTPTPQSPPQSEAPMPDVKVPSIATRRAACTHLTMEPLYGDFTCNICSRFSSFGWVYCCTQDDPPGSRPPPNSISETTNPPPTAKLSPWIAKAIDEGHYTPEQIDQLRAQKQHVVDTARLAIDQFEQSQSNVANSLSLTPTTLQSVDANPHLPFPVINEVQEPAAIDPPSPGATLIQQSKLRMFPFCKFCACQLCRPTHRDRAWQSFDDIFAKDQEIPFIHYEDSNRPLASASILRKIGLRPPRLPKRPLLGSLGNRAIYSRNDQGKFVLNQSHRESSDPAGSSTDITDIKVEPESKGFREGMKRAFKSMLMTRRSSSRSLRKRKSRDGTDTTDENTVEFDMGLWTELNDELLREASAVPLPGKDSIERLTKDVAKMEVGSTAGVAGVTGVGGVAVTEEAADLGTADVIMSV